MCIGGGGVQNKMNERMHQCTTLNTTGIYKNLFFGKYAYERLSFSKQIHELLVRPKFKIFLPANFLILF
jgi:hypothetical protein